MHLKINGTKIATTENHSFCVIGKGWVKAGDLKAGNKVSLKTGEIGNVDSVEVEELDELDKGNTLLIYIRRCKFEEQNIKF